MDGSTSSRHPLWEPQPDPEAAHVEFALHRREALGTSTLDAIPEMRIPLPGNTVIPFLTAVAATLIAVSLMFSLTLFIVGSLLTTILLFIWHWPTAQQRDMEWVKAGPPGALQRIQICRLDRLAAEGYGEYLPLFAGVKS